MSTSRKAIVRSAPRPAKTDDRAGRWMRGFSVSLGAWACFGSALAQTDVPDDGAVDLAAAGEASAQQNQHFRLAAYWENDGAFVLKPLGETDRHYTNGVGVSLTWDSPSAEAFVTDTLGLSADGVALGLIFAQEMFTPDDIETETPDPDDRPYAGYLYGGVYLQREHDDVLDDVQLNLGVVGPSALAEPVQEAIHDFFSADDPGGWDFQLDDEPAIQLTYRRKWRFDVFTEELGADWGAQVVPYGELNVGTVHRNVGGGATFRLGYHLPDDFGPGRLRDPGSFTGGQRDNATGNPRHPLGRLDDRGWSVYGYARVAGRYVEWNTFLDGSNFQDPSPSVSKEPWVGEAEAGVSAAYQSGRHRFSATYSTTWLTREFEDQGVDDSYAALSLTWTLAY